MPSFQVSSDIIPLDPHVGVIVKSEFITRSLLVSSSGQRLFYLSKVSFYFYLWWGFLALNVLSIPDSRSFYLSLLKHWRIVGFFSRLSFFLPSFLPSFLPFFLSFFLSLFLSFWLCLFFVIWHLSLMDTMLQWLVLWFDCYAAPFFVINSLRKKLY